LIFLGPVALERWREMELPKGLDGRETGSFILAMQGEGEER